MKDYKLSTLIVEDTKADIEAISYLVEKSSRLHLFGYCEQGAQALEMVNNGGIDLVILDVELGDESGIDLIRTIKKKSLVICVSSYVSYAYHAIDALADSFLVKPIKASLWNEIIERTWQHHQLLQNKSVVGNKVSSKSFFCKADSGWISIEYDNIILFMADGDYCELKLKSGKVLTNFTSLGKIESTLPSKSFIRIHRKYIINVEKIKRLDSNTVELEGGFIIPIGRKYKEEFRSSLGIL